MAYIIAVAGPIGSGKSTLVKAIAAALGDASTLYYDSYEQATQQAPREVIQWMREGADFNAFVLPELVNDLSKLKRGSAITDPLTGQTVAAANYIIFEMPLGRGHRQTAPFIDLLLWIDIPFDVSLARKIREYTEMLLAEGHRKSARESLGWLKGYIDNYLAMIRPLLEIQVERVRPDADYIINGRSNPREMAHQAAKKILSRLPRAGQALF